ncbi:aminoacyl-tRNA hydrolase [Brachyspira alvinipulli]|uniref:aminoacyl-tRNA hydrolase n=1 Tax=Brachyspira alvinipulli TaxID=84379 RepID=UPI0004BC2C9C|nr:aminoacyl-tRNA hydrolase [Brachyspira alvinipulli]
MITKLVIGLGNPGEEYKNNRHNIGFIMLDKIAQNLSVNFDNNKKKSLYGRAKKNDIEYILLKPLTYMNLSGESASYITKFFNINVEDIIVIYDDMDIPFGTFKIKKGGSSGGHNGIKSLIAHLKSDDFTRIRIGIGRPSAGKQVNDYVLSSFNKSEREQLDNDIAIDIIEAVKTALFESPIIAQNKYNKRLNNKKDDKKSKENKKMIKIIAKNPVKQENKSKFIETAKELIEKSRKEEGCISYSLYESTDGKYLTFIEEWKDEKAIESHNNSQHFKSIVPKLGEMLDGEMDVVLYKEIK